MNGAASSITGEREVRAGAEELLLKAAQGIRLREDAGALKIENEAY